MDEKDNGSLKTQMKRTLIQLTRAKASLDHTLSEVSPVPFGSEAKPMPGTLADLVAEVCEEAAAVAAKANIVAIAVSGGDPGVGDDAPDDDPDPVLTAARRPHAGPLPTPPRKRR